MDSKQFTKLSLWMGSLRVKLHAANGEEARQIIIERAIEIMNEAGATEAERDELLTALYGDVVV